MSKGQEKHLQKEEKFDDFDQVIEEVSMKKWAK